jgi:ParB family transcriptional regulator, chromosome partitioning protein
MTVAKRGSQVVHIPLDKITVINPRSRNRKTFETIVRNIGQLGLKRPITVMHKQGGPRDRYDLVCGQGRLEAYRILGHAEIPAIVVDATEEDGLIMGLVENIARRQHRAIDLLHDIEGMKRRGYSEAEIAQKTDLTVEYVRGVIQLLENGEHRLLAAVESGTIPISVAVQIASSEDGEVQRALQQAYEAGKLKGKKLAVAQQLVEQRRRRGKTFGPTQRKTTGKLSANTLVRIYKQDVERKRLLVQKAEATKERLMFVVQALKALYADEALKAVLRSEDMDTLPKTLALRMQGV